MAWLGGIDSRCMILVFVGLLCVASLAHADTDTSQPGFSVVEDSDIPIATTDSALEDALMNSGQRVDEIGHQRLQQGPGLRTATALQSLAGVDVQKDSTTAVSPIIRGLSGPRVVVFVDGVRLNNSLWRPGSAASLNLIAREGLHSIVVFNGPAATLLGAEAMGGALSLRSEHAANIDDDLRVSAKLLTHYQSASDGKLLRAEGATCAGPLALKIGGELAEYALQRGGRDVGVQDFTEYRFGDLNANVQFAAWPGQHLALTYTAHRGLDAPRTSMCSRYESGHIKDCLQLAEQDLDLVGLHYRGRSARLFDDIGATVSLQRYHELNERLRWDRARQDTRQDDVLAIGAHAYASQPIMLLPLQLRMTVGADFYRDLLESQAWRKSLRGRDAVPRESLGDPVAGDATVADGAEYTSTSLFLQTQAHVTASLSVHANLRYTAYWISADDDSRLSQALERGFAGPSANLFVEQRFGTLFSLTAGLAHSYRAPNVFELTGRDHFAAGYEFADASTLKGERLSSVETIARLQLGPLTSTLGAYAGLLHDLIVRTPSLFDEQKLYDGALVFERINAGLAYLMGVEASAQLSLPAHTQVYATYAYTFGHNESYDEPLSRVPPPRGTCGVRGQLLTNFEVGAYVWWALAQQRLSAEDLIDSRIAEDGTPGYVVLGAHASYRIAKHIDVGLTLHNVLDSSYRFHGSGLEEPGVEGQLRVAVGF